MKKQLFAVAALSLLMLSGQAMAADSVSTKSDTTYTPSSNGGYESQQTTEHTDANGTTTKRNTDENVDVDSKGNKETKVKIKSSTDPKGLFNKDSSEIENKAVEKDGKTEYSHKKTVNGSTVEESDQKTEKQ